MLHLAHHNVHLTKQYDDQEEYFGYQKDGSFKPEYLRYENRANSIYSILRAAIYPGVIVQCETRILCYIALCPQFT